MQILWYPLSDFSTFNFYGHVNLFTVELVSINVRRSPSITTLTTQRDIFSLGRRQLIILCLHLNQVDKQQTVATWPRRPSTQVSQNWKWPWDSGDWEQVKEEKNSFSRKIESTIISYHKVSLYKCPGFPVCKTLALEKWAKKGKEG